MAGVAVIEIYSIISILSLRIHKYWSLYTFFNVLHLIFAYLKSSITKVIEIENGKEQKDFTLLLIALFCSSLAHAQKQVPAERKDSIDNGSNIIKIVGNHSNKGAGQQCP